VLSYATPISSCNLVGDSIYAAHSNFVSRYSLLNEKWVAHMKFDKDIVNVFRIKNKKATTAGKKKKKEKKEGEEDKEGEKDKKQKSDL
jgi:hypothetical protein